MQTSSTAASLKEYLECVERIENHEEIHGSTQPLWYRGQKSASWKVLPKAYRIRTPDRLEPERLRCFNLLAPSVGNLPANGQSPTGPLEWMCAMQHHGVITRLIDWTETALIALWFAVEGDAKSDAAVWVLDPWVLNGATLGRKSVPLANDSLLSSYAINDDRAIGAALPAAFRPRHVDARLHAQNGVFTIHGSKRNALETIVELKKIVIPRDARAKMFNELSRSGFAYSRVFPDLDGLAREANYRFPVSRRSSRQNLTVRQEHSPPFSLIDRRQAASDTRPIEERVESREKPWPPPLTGKTRRSRSLDE